MKDELIRSWSYKAGKDFSKSNPLHGSAILPDSIPPDRLHVKSLSSITANIGSIFAGDVTIGDPLGARVVLGDSVGGIVGFDSAGRAVLKWSNDGSRLTIGLNDQGGYQMYTSGTKLFVNGDVLVSGTVQAAALSIGQLATVFLDEDEIRIGAGTVGTDFDGFRISQDAIGGYSNNVLTWYVDSDTGHIITQASGANSETYTKIGAGYIEISNDYDLVTSVLRFRSLQSTGGTENRVDVQYKSYPNNLDTIRFKNIDGEYAPAIELMNNLNTAVATYGSDSITLSGYNQLTFTLTTAFAGTGGAADILFDGNAVTLMARDIDIATGIASGIAQTKVRGDGLELWRGVLYTTPDLYGAWAPRPTTPLESTLHYDWENNRWEYYNGTAWRSLDNSAT